jgi:hypothetical protein
MEISVIDIGRKVSDRSLRNHPWKGKTVAVGELAPDLPLLRTANLADSLQTRLLHRLFRPGITCDPESYS